MCWFLCIISLAEIFIQWISFTYLLKLLGNFFSWINWTNEFLWRIRVSNFNGYKSACENGTVLWWKKSINCKLRQYLSFNSTILYFIYNVVLIFEVIGWLPQLLTTQLLTFYGRYEDNYWIHFKFALNIPKKQIAQSSIWCKKHKRRLCGRMENFSSLILPSHRIELQSLIHFYMCLLFCFCGGAESHLGANFVGFEQRINNCSNETIVTSALPKAKSCKFLCYAR